MEQTYTIEDLDLTPTQKKRYDKVRKQLEGPFELNNWNLIRVNINKEMKKEFLEMTEDPVENMQKEQKKLKEENKERKKKIRIIKSLLGNVNAQVTNIFNKGTYIVDEIKQNCITAELADINTKKEKKKSEAGKQLFGKEE